MASDVLDIAATIEGKLNTDWAGATAILWENAKEEPPSVAVSWIQPTILWGDAFLITKNGRNTLVGVLSVNIFTPKNSGMGASDALVNSLRDIFNRLKLTGADQTVRFGIPTAGQQTGDPSEGWMVKNVSIPFDVDETGT